MPKRAICGGRELMGRFVGNGKSAPPDQVGELLRELGLASEDPHLRRIAADALDPNNPMHWVDLTALRNIAERRSSWVYRWTTRRSR